MNRLRLAFFLFFMLAGSSFLRQAQAGTMTNVAEFVPRRLGDQGWEKLHTVLDDNHVVYITVEFAATTLAVSPSQAELARKLIKELIDKDKLRITLLDEGH